MNVRCVKAIFFTIFYFFKTILFGILVLFVYHYGMKTKNCCFCLAVVFGILSKYSCNHTLFSSPLFFSFNLDTRVCFCLFELFNFYGWESLLPIDWLVMFQQQQKLNLDSLKEENRYVLNVYNREKCSFFFSFYFNQFPRRKPPSYVLFLFNTENEKIIIFIFFFHFNSFFFRG